MRFVLCIAVVSLSFGGPVQADIPVNSKYNLLTAKARLEKLEKDAQDWYRKTKTSVQRSVKESMGEVAQLTTALHIDTIKQHLLQAIQENNVERVKLYASKLDVKELAQITSLTGGTVVHHAISQARDLWHSEAMLMHLLPLLKDVDNFLRLQDLQGRTALHLAAERGFHTVVELMAQQPSFDTRIKNNKGFWPAHLAALKGHKKTSLVLYEAIKDEPHIDSDLGFDTWPDNVDQDLFGYAAYLDVIEFLAMFSDIDISRIRYSIFTDWATNVKSLHAVMSMAGTRGHVHILEKIMESPAYKQQNEDEQKYIWTQVLVSALRHLSGYWSPGIQDPWVITVKLATENQADVNDIRALTYCDGGGGFGLAECLVAPSIAHLAVKSGNIEVVKLVVEAGARLDLYYEGSTTAADSALQMLEQQAAHTSSDDNSGVYDAQQRENYLSMYQYLAARTPKKKTFKECVKLLFKK